MRFNKKTVLVLLLFLTPTYCLTARETFNFNGRWRYAQGDFAGAENPAYDDSGWTATCLPHSFSIPYFMAPDFYVGYGWYRKRFKLAPKALGGRVMLEFDGVFQDAEVFVNEVFVGRHQGGYTGFNIDITEACLPGNNLVAVRVNNLWRPDMAPRAGEHTFSGGIYRNVRLVLKNNAYIPQYGIGITTPELAQHCGKGSTIAIKAEVVNATDKATDYTLRCSVYDNNNNAVTEIRKSLTVNPSDTILVEMATPFVNNPQLWSVDNPVRYRMVSNLYRGDKLLDSDTTRFGFRWIEWTADRGFFLNGKHIYLQGANVHQDHAGWGDAVTDGASMRDVKMMKEAGFNFIRGSHYPHSPAFTEACDSVGIMFWSEASFWGIGGFKPDGYWNSSAYPVDTCHEAAFDASALNQLAEMIRIHRNHPSVIVWSMCNEAFFSAPEAMNGVRQLLKKMVTECHRLDPSRAAAVGGVQRPLGEDRIDIIGDVAGYNGDGATINDFIDPGMPTMVSEYGSITADRPGEYAPGWGSLDAEEAWRGRPWRSGQAIWCGFDHGSIAGAQLGKMGIVDYFRIPKRAWYWYRNTLTGVQPPEWPSDGIPAKLKLSVSTSKPVRADGTDDVHVLITVLDADGKEISNSPDVTLRIVSGPGEFPTGRSICFSNDNDIRVQDGKAAIEMRAYRSGHTVVEATSPGLEPARIEIDFTEGIDPDYREPVKREYVRYENTDSRKEPFVFGRSNPMFASSSASSHAPGLAGDGNQATWWESALDDVSPTLILDTEKGPSLKNITIIFPDEAKWKYKIDTSLDGKTWRTLSTCNGKSAHKSMTHEYNDNEKAQFIRIMFEVKGAVAELSVTGFILE